MRVVYTIRKLLTVYVQQFYIALYLIPSNDSASYWLVSIWYVSLIEKHLRSY